MRLGTRRCEDCLRRGMAGCSHSSSCLALKLTGLPAADFLFITVRAWWGTEGIRRKGGEAGEPTNSQAEQQCPQVSAAKPGATPYPFSLPSELSFPLSFTEKKDRASLSFPRKEVQSAHQLVSPRVEDKSTVPGAGGLGVSGVLRVIRLCHGQQLGG